MITVTQAAIELEVSQETVRNFHKRGTLTIISSQDRNQYVKIEDIEKITGKKVDEKHRIDFSNVFTLTQAAKELGIGLEPLRLWRIKGKIKTQTLPNGQTVIHKDEINRIKNAKIAKHQSKCKYCGKVDNKENFIKYRKICLGCKDAYTKSRCLKSRIKQIYKVSLEEYNKVIESNNGVCEICGESPEKICFDHDHQTDKARGSLCHKCNSGLGLLKDDMKVLEKALYYLRKHEIINTEDENINIYYYATKRGVLPS